MIKQQQIEKLSNAIFEDVVSWRRHLHKNPELSFQENETAKFVSSILTKYKIEHKTGIAKTGIVALIKGNSPDKKCIALRADLDALPIQETNLHSFISKNKGVMHACGHDYHTATILGVGVILNELKDSFEGTIKLIFQPSEEKLPGGAKVMIEEGVLEKPKVDFIIAQHVTPEVNTGKVGIAKGVFMASADEIYLKVKGKGGHAAFPEKLNDPVITAAQILTNLQQVISRKKDPFLPAVLSFGKVIANGATNIVPNEVKIEGTLRAMNEKWRKEAHSSIKTTAENTAKANNCSCEVDIKIGYPCLENNIELSEKTTQFAEEILGKENVFEIEKRMGAEDFAYYSQQIPACFIRTGTGINKATRNGLHTSNFDVDENAFKTSLKLFSWLAIKL
ncbi:MAG: M20 metallopeptidase family protein [Chitinophagales bacterium]